MAKIVQTAGRNALGEFAPEFAHYNDDVLFGENWNNQDIDVKTFGRDESPAEPVAWFFDVIFSDFLKVFIKNYDSKVSFWS